jgi:hypothetical protein
MIAAAQGQAESARIPKAAVQITSVSKVFIAKNTPAYLVSYTYDFADVSAVHIRGLGLVPPQGRYQYLSVDHELEFRDPATDAVLKRVPIEETAIIAAKPPLNEVPGDNQFASAYRAYVWDASTSLQERANTVLATYFNYLPHQSGTLTYLATTYTQLPLDKKLAANGILAQLAILLSFPHDPLRGKYMFYVQYSVREGRALSDELRPTSNADIIRAANEFADRMVAEMKGAR